MTTRKTIIEWQQAQKGDAEYPGLKSWTSDYTYVGPSRDGAYLFKTPEGNLEVFARRKDRPAGWHLEYGLYFYEFVRGGQ